MIPEPKTQSPESKPRRTLPNDYDIECALICALLIDDEAIIRLPSSIVPEAFYDPRHKAIFSAMVDLNLSATPIDILTVSNRLKTTGKLEAAGGDGYIAALSGYSTTSAHIEAHAKTVYDMYALRRLIRVGTGIVDSGVSVADPVGIIDTAMQSLLDIQTSKTADGFESLFPVMSRTVDHLNKLASRSEDSLTGITSGYRDLDHYTSGWQSGDLVILAARPSMGKTALALEMARRSAKTGKRVGIFSLEMSAPALALRLLAAESHCNLLDLRNGRLGKCPDLNRHIQSVSDLPIFIDDSGSVSISDIRSRARRLRQQEKVDMIVVDYLQLIHGPSTSSREQEVSQISRSLKGIARDLDIPVIALSQLSRAPETRTGDKRPQLSDLRDSGAIEQDADLVMFIYREPPASASTSLGDPAPPGRETELLIRKQRNGPTGVVKLIFFPETTAFEDAAHE